MMTMEQSSFAFDPQAPCSLTGGKDDEASNCLFVTRSLSWTGNSLASSFDGCELDARSQSVVAPSLDAASLSLHEGLLSGDSKASSGQIQEFPASLDSSASGMLLRNAGPSGSFRSQPSSSAPSSQQAVCLASEACVRGEVASNEQLRIPVTSAREAPEPNMKGSRLPSSVTRSSVSTCPSSRQSSRSQPSANTHDAQISVPDERPAWLAHRETQAAILEMLDEEVVAAINPSYMEFHSDAVMPDGLCITPAMRLMTINWMSEAIYALDLDQRVVAMAVNLLDRYLSASRQFPRTMLQLAAASAIFVASKIEGVLPHPRASRVASLSDGAFDLERLIAFERVMCHSLGFDLYSPTTQNFLDMWMHALPTPVGESETFFAEKVHSLASYILELGSLVYDTLRHKRSLLATAALLLALGDPGLHQGVATALNVQPAHIREHAHTIVANLRHYIGPHTDVVEVTVATAELLRLHRLAKAPENREQFVVAKFASPRFDYIAEVAHPLASAEEFHVFMQIYYGSAV